MTEPTDEQREKLRIATDRLILREKIRAVDMILRGGAANERIPATHALKPGDKVQAPIRTPQGNLYFRAVVVSNPVAGEGALRIQSPGPTYGIVADLILGYWRPRMNGLDEVSDDERAARAAAAEVNPYGQRDNFDAKEFSNALVAGNAGVKSAEVEHDEVGEDGVRRVRVKVEASEPVEAIGVDFSKTPFDDVQSEDRLSRHAPMPPEDDPNGVHE